MEKCIVYIGEFDIRNENVQSHLVVNNGKILNLLGYKVIYVGVNRQIKKFKDICKLKKLYVDSNFEFFELPNTFNFLGVFKCATICQYIIKLLSNLAIKYNLEYVISYQSPSYAIAIKRIIKWCKKNNAKYIVNCADLPIFFLQSPIKKFVMKINWLYLNNLNKKYADGVIAVSSYIKEYYYKKGRNEIIIPPLFDNDKFKVNIKSNEVPTFVYAGLPFVITGKKASIKGMKDRLDKIIDLFLLLSKKNVKFIFYVIGITKDDYLVSVPRHNLQLLKETNIKFLGRYNHCKTIEMISQADFTINYRDEKLMTKAGFSTKIVESVSVGTPVIINNISDTFFYLEDGLDGFSLSGDLKIDLNKIEKVCSLTEKQRYELKENLYKKEIFNIKKYVIPMKSFLDSMNIKREEL